MHQVPHKLTACNTVEWSCCALYTHIFCVRIASTAWMRWVDGGAAMGVHEGGWCLPSISPPVAKTGGAFASTCSPFAFGDFLLMAVNLLLPAKPPSSRRYVTQLCPGGMARRSDYCVTIRFLIIELLLNQQDFRHRWSDWRLEFEKRKATHTHTHNGRKAGLSCRQNQMKMVNQKMI